MSSSIGKSNPYLSKSLFLRGLQCLKSLYLDRNTPELRDEITEQQQATFQTGTDVGSYARQLYPNGTEIPYEGLSLIDQVNKTRSLIDNNAAILYEAAFSHENIFIKADILVKENEGWSLYEVKSSTDVKDIYYHDVAIQYYVLTGAGINIEKAFVVHINNQYIKNGPIEPERLFTIRDVTKETLKKQPEVVKYLTGIREMLSQQCPETDIGVHCNDPYPCDFHGHCWKHIPEISVFNIARIGAKAFDFYHQGIINFSDIPTDKLNASQRLQVEATLGQKTPIEKGAIKDFLYSLWYPLCFLDFETFYTPIPLFDGSRPYQQIPYQYSLHTIEAEGTDPKHTEFLAEAGKDQRKQLADKLMADIPDKACVLAYNKTFEIRVLKELAGIFPEYRVKVQQIVDNMIDLGDPFKNKSYYDWRMNGSWSLKTVLPLLVPELTYKDLEIGNGSMAMDAYFKLSQIDDMAEKNRIRTAMLEYCNLDTYAMVRLWQVLNNICHTDERK